MFFIGYPVLLGSSFYKVAASGMSYRKKSGTSRQRNQTEFCELHLKYSAHEQRLLLEIWICPFLKVILFHLDQSDLFMSIAFYRSARCCNWRTTLWPLGWRILPKRTDKLRQRQLSRNQHSSPKWPLLKCTAESSFPYNISLDMCELPLVKFSLNKIQAPVKSIGSFYWLWWAWDKACAAATVLKQRKCSFTEAIYIASIILSHCNYTDLQRTALPSVPFTSCTHFCGLQCVKQRVVSQAQPNCRLVHPTGFTDVSWCHCSKLP